jgi:hypothetical protein
MDNINLDDLPTKNKTVVGRVLEGKTPLETEAVLVLPDKGQVKVINEVGARIWSLIDGTNTVRQIVSIICSEYEIDDMTAEADVKDFLTNLAVREIIQFVQKTQ